MQVIVKPVIHSISDIITNSSSETFLIDNNNKIHDVKKFILSYGEEQLRNGIDSCGGLGGKLSIYDYKDAFENYKKVYNKDSSFTYEDFAKAVDIPLEELEDMLVIYIDNKRVGTIRMLNTLFKVYDNSDKYYKLFWLCLN